MPNWHLSPETVLKDSKQHVDIFNENL